MELSPDQLASRYERLRNEDVYKDVTLTSHKNVVSAHKCVLSIGSQFFKLLFKQAQRKRDMFHRSSFELVGLTEDVARHLDAVIDFLYSGVIYINDKNFTGIMKLADYLAIEELFDLAEKYLEQRTTKENCLKLYLDMKKILNGESSKGTSSSCRKTDDILRSLWTAVETNFYGYIIDHHEFLEVIPEEIEELLRKNFVIQKVLSLAERWMKTWPLGFTFAESLINISHSNLSTAIDDELTDKHKAEVVNSIKTIREQVHLRTVPKSNKENILKKLKEIQKTFDKQYAESDIEEETEAGKDGGDTRTNDIETDIEMECKKVPKSNELVDKKEKSENEDLNGQGLMLTENDEVSTSEVLSTGDTGIISASTDGDALKSENKAKRKNEKQVENIEDETSEQLCDTGKGENYVASKLDGNGESEKGQGESREESDMDNTGTIANRDKTVMKGCSVNDKNGLDDTKEEGKLEDIHTVVPDHADTVEGRAEDITDISDTVRLTERKKIDGTEEEVPDSVSEENAKSPKMYFINDEQVTDSKTPDGTVEGESTLHDRVAECLKLQRVVKKENEDAPSQVTKTKPARGKRGRGRPRKSVETDLDGESELNISAGTRSRTRGIKRKVNESDFGISGSEIDETVVKIEIDNYVDDDTDGKVIETKEEMADGTEPDWEKDTKSEGEGDSDDDYSENIFAEALKNVSGIDVIGSATPKSARKRSPRKPGHHECEVCNKVYSQKYRLTQHMNMHLGIKPYKCVVCLQCFTRTDHVVRHMKSQHGDLDVYKCDECDEEFEKANEMVTHTLVHIPQSEDAEDRVVTLFTDAEKEYITVSSQETGRPQYSCTKCSQSFRRPYQAREHINYHTGEKPFKCNECDASYAKKENLNAHVRSVHEGRKGEYKCSKCRRFFIKKENFEAHVEKCEPNYPCKQCPMKFYRKTHLDNHTPVHDVTPQHKCPHCENAYRYRKHMLRHIRKDHMNPGETDTPCICDICGVVLKNKEALYRHKKVHKTPDKECDVCGKAFKDNTTLKDHKVMHTNIRDYQCEICSMLFARKGNLIRHQKRHRGERKYRCEMCGMCFVANCDLTRHKNTHLGVKKFPCRYCGRKFGLKSKVVVHERTHTGERPYLCRDEACGKTFKQTGDRVRHEKKVHSLTYNKYMTLYELATGESEDIFKGSDGMTLPNKVTTLPVNAGFAETATDLSASQETAMETSAQGVGNGSYSQSSDLNNSFIEEAEMSKIFQRTVAAISQEAIASSGLYN